MDDKELSNKPLVEAIFELRWQLTDMVDDIRIDDNYDLIIGQIFQKLSSDYSFHQTLPQTRIPKEMAAYLVQHRFRRQKDGWPLIQLGPGLITLNDTTDYSWPDFESRIHALLDVLYEVYPNSEKDFIPNGLKLRYIDAIDFNFSESSVFDFLKKTLKTSIELHKPLFDQTGVNNIPLAFDFGFSFQCDEPRGAAHLRFSRGKKNGKDALFWETQITSFDDDVPKSKDDVFKWLEKSHGLTHDWFFKLIDGDLYERFK